MVHEREEVGKRGVAPSRGLRVVMRVSVTDVVKKVNLKVDPKVTRRKPRSPGKAFGASDLRACCQQKGEVKLHHGASVSYAYSIV